jgi:hypothetical protein
MITAMLIISTVLMATIIGYTAALCFDLQDSSLTVGLFIALALWLLIVTSWGQPERHSVI